VKQPIRTRGALGLHFQAHGFHGLLAA
jgi:hypothetical protein